MSSRDAGERMFVIVSRDKRTREWKHKAIKRIRKLSAVGDCGAPMRYSRRLQIIVLWNFAILPVLLSTITVQEDQIHLRQITYILHMLISSSPRFQIHINLPSHFHQ